jgi:TonB family protein
MPTSKAPADVNEPGKSKGASPEAGPAVLEDSGNSAEGSSDPSHESSPSSPPVVRGSRWVDYDTHELLEMIGELEDERRWARLREGIWIAILFHLFLLSAITWIPKYILKVPAVVDPFDAIKERKDLTYLDVPPDALQKARPKPATKPLSKPPVIDKKTLEDMQKSAPPPQETKAPEQTQPQPQAPVPPKPQTESQVDAPRPAAVPARPNFAMNSDNPADQLRDAMRNAAQSHGAGGRGNLGPDVLTQHPGAGTGGVQVLSDTQGVDFSSWLQRWHYETERTWDPLIPEEVNAPLNKSGAVAIQFKVLPNGRITDMHLVGQSGDVALDRAAWGALTGSNYPPLPRDFHGPYLELRAYFLYNMQPR